MGFDMGKSESEQRASSTNQATSGSKSWQTVWQNQIPYLESLYSTGSDAIKKMMAQGQDTSQFQDPARAAWAKMIGGQENPALAGAIKQAQARAGEGFQEQVMPGLTGAAINAGALGGDRGGIAAGIAAREAMREQGDIATRMTFDDYQGSQQRILEALQMTGGLNSLSQSSLAPLLALSQILGRPTTLSGSEAASQQTGSSESRGDSESWNFGASWTGA